ncbi:MAG: SdrD B-like domain-containing protein [Bacteroidota bacterium]
MLLTTSQAQRVTTDLLALYEFDEGAGSTVYDKSSVGTPLNLQIGNTGNIQWLSGNGINIQSATILQTPVAASKIMTACMSSHEVTMEAWVRPQNSSQSGPARIMSISENTAKRNMTLGQSGSRYIGRVRTGTANNGTPDNQGPSSSVSTSQVQHLVYTYENGQDKIYLNGALVATRSRSGDFSNWDTGYHLMMGNEMTQDRKWLGEIYLSAVYSRALTPTEITQNYQAGYVTTPPNPNEDWVEAECGTVGSLWQQKLDGDASQGQYVEIQSGYTSYNSATTSASGQVRYNVEVSSAGYYNVFGRILTPSYSENSFWVKVNNSSWAEWHTGVFSAWSWEKVTDYGYNPYFYLNSGSNVITVAYREPGSKLDKLFVSQSNTVPSGLGGAAQGCAPTFEAPEGWSHECGSGIEVEVVGQGVKGYSSATLNFANSSSVDSVILIVTSKAGGYPSSITFTGSNGQTAVATPKVMPSASGSSTSSVREYKVKIDGNLSSATASGLNSYTYSYVAYVFRSNSSYENGEIAIPVGEYFYHSDKTYTMDIPASSDDRNITIQVPLSEINNDSRIVNMTVEAGGVTETVTANTYDQGNSLLLLTATLQNVPAGTDEITIEIESPSSNGDSFGATGYITADIDCNTCSLPTIYKWVRVNYGSWQSTTVANVCVGDVVELCVDPINLQGYQWAGPNGYTSTLSTPIISDSITTAEEGVYTLTYTDPTVANCGTTINFTVNVSEPMVPTINLSANQINANQTVTISTNDVNDYQRIYIPVGSFYTGSMDRMIFGADDDATGGSNTMFRDVQVYESNTGNGVNIDFNNYTISSYGTSQDNGTYAVSNNGGDLMIQDNAWKSIDLNYNVTIYTILSFEVKTTDIGELHFIGFDNDMDEQNSLAYLFMLFGSDAWGTTSNEHAYGAYSKPEYNWNFGSSASPATGVGLGPFNVTYAGGTQVVSLEVDQGYCDYTYTDTIEVACPTVDAGVDVEICECDLVSNGVCQDNGRAVTLTASGGSSYTWSNGATTQSITVSPLFTTTYTVTTSGPGSCSNTADVTVTVVDGPEADFQQIPTVALCENETFVFEAVNQGPGVASSEYVWDFGPTASPSSAIGIGPHQVRFLVTSGQTDCREVTLSVGSGACMDVNKANVFIAPTAHIDSLDVSDPSCQETTGSVTVNTEGWVIGESGMVTVSQNNFGQWHTLNYNNTYEKPVIIMQSLTSGDVNPAHVRVRNTGHMKTEFQIEEWDYQDGYHGAENISYIILEQGTHTLSDGTTIEAGYTNIGSSFSSVSLNGGYTATPVVLTQVASDNYSRSVVTRQKSVGTTSFQVRLQNKESYEKSSNSHPGNEKVSFIAIEQTQGSANGQAFEAGLLLDVTHSFKQLTYSQSFGATPALVYSMQSYDGGDPAAIRHKSQDQLGAQLRIEEETSHDSETNHTTEHIGYIAFEMGDIYAGMEYRVDGGTWTIGENSYTFENLALGSHTLETRTINGCNTSVADTTVSIGSGQCASLGDFIWEDTNENGVQDGTESGIAGIKVYLLEGCTGLVKLDSTTTNGNGIYTFDNLNVGDSYRVQLAQEVIDNGYTVTGQNTGTDEAVDSDAGANGVTDCVTLSQAGAYNDLDIGLNYECTVTDPGTIGGDQSYCTVLGVYPTPITNVSEADGGVGVEYQWRWSERTDIPFEFWVVKPNSNMASMTINHIVSKTCYLVRMARKCPGEAWVPSNVIAIEINYTPKTSFSITYPEGTTVQSSNDSVKVIFEARTWPNASYSWDLTGSLNPMGIPMDSTGRKVYAYYTSPTTYTASLTMSTPECDSTLSIFVKIDDAAGCSNITDPGTISGDQYSCSVPYDASTIGGEAATGAVGAVEYEWAYSNDLNVPVQLWEAIPSGNSTSIDPDQYLGLLTQTTYFVRRARSIGCNAFRHSNVVTIEVQENLQSACEITEPASQNFGANLPGVIQGGTSSEYSWHYETAQVLTYADGTARVTGLLRNNENENMQWRASIQLKARQDWMQWEINTSAYGGTYRPSIAAGSMDYYAWDYYEIDVDNSYLIGDAYNLGDSLTISQGYVQVGIGANGLDLGYGVYSEFAFGSVSGNYSGTGTLANELQNCREVCLPEVRVAARVLMEGAFNQTQGAMNNNLAVNNMIPLSQPFAPYGFTEVVTLDSIPTGVADWMLLQVRSESDSAHVVAQAVGFVKPDGDLVGLDGHSLISLPIDPREDYYISVIAKGHLGVMTKSAKVRKGVSLMHDFTADISEIYTLPGTANPAMVQLPTGQYALWAGDTDLNGAVNSVDFSQVLINYFQTGYFLTDIDLTGIINSVDYQFVAKNYFKFAQLPRKD